MVSTRRGAAGATAPDQVAKPSKAQRGARRKPAVASPVQPVATKRRLRSAKESDSPLRALKSPPKRKRAKVSTPTPEPVSEEQQEPDPGAGIFFRMKPVSLPTLSQEEAEATFNSLNARIRELEDELHTTKFELTTTKKDADRVRQENNSLFKQLTDLRTEHALPMITEGTVKGTQDALDLLHMIEDSAKTAPPVDPEPASPEPGSSLASPGDATDHFTSTLENPGSEVQQQPPKPANEPSPLTQPTDAPAPAAPALDTPARRGFSISRLFSSLRASFSPSRAAPPALVPESPTPGSAVSTSTAQDSTQNLSEISELTMTLTPTPTPVGEARKHRKQKKKKSHRQVMVSTVAKSVQDPEEQAKAKAWADGVLRKLALSPVALGDKRKRLESGVKVGDLKRFQGTKPWKSGSYGLDDDIGDLSDDEDAPAWAVLQEIVLEEEDPLPPTKKHKYAHEIVMDEVEPLNGTFISTTAKPSLPKVVNTNGQSASLSDLRPRSSVLPSPMFEGAPPHQTGANVFIELQGQNVPSAADRRAALNRSARQNDAVPSTNSFSVPDDSDSDEENEPDSANEPDHLLWTQQPPPAPVPAHASLPPPLAESPTIPEVSPVKAVDPVELQRAKITKHTPAKPSRLREVHVPSPSLKSDAGNESNYAASPVKDNPLFSGSSEEFADMPDAVPLDVPAEMIENYLKSDQYKAHSQEMDWEDPVLSYSDNE